MSGPQLDQLDEVFTKIDSLGTQIQKVAYAVILLGEKQNKLARNPQQPTPVVLVTYRDMCCTLYMEDGFCLLVLAEDICKVILSNLR